MTLIRLIVANLILLVCACSPDAFRCPKPHPEKLKKASVNHLKLYQLHRQEQMTARAKEKEYDELMRSLQQRSVKTGDPEEWDCPKPGSAHARLLQKHRKRLEAQNAKELRKKAGDRQLPYYGSH